MSPPSRPVRAAVIPAAGLGSRLTPLTLGSAKELLPLGRYPALVATLLEAAAANISELVVVSSPDKPGLRRFLQGLLGGTALDSASALGALQALVAELHITLVEQPQPVGALDAVARGLAALPGGEAVAVLFPDLVQLPDQTALQRLVAAYEGCRASLFGLRLAVAGEAKTSTVAVRLATPLRPAELLAAQTSGEPLRISALGAATGTPGELLTTFGQIQTATMSAAIEAHCLRQPGSPLEDRHLPAALAALAASGELFGVLLPGEILDLGTLPSYVAAARRFFDGSARLRDLPA